MKAKAYPEMFQAARLLVLDCAREAVRPVAQDVPVVVPIHAQEIVLVDVLDVQAVLEAVSEDVILMLAREDVQVDVRIFAKLHAKVHVKKERNK